MTYTLYRVHSFACDWPECTREVEDVNPNKQEVWMSFAQYGWRRDGDKHYCPQHAMTVKGATK